MTIAIAFLTAVLVSAALAGLWRAVALRLGYVAAPTARDPQARSKARFGGVPIACALFGTAAILGTISTLPLLVVCGVALVAFGLAAEVLQSRAATKVVAAVAVACVFLYFDWRLQWTESLTLDGLLTVLWIVGIVAAFDLLDNMDGLCAGITIIATTSFLLTIVPLASGDISQVRLLYLAVLAGSVTGFLPYNMPPASLAMGASGSLLLGLHMAALTLQFAPGRSSDLVSIVAVPVLVLLIPVGDAILSTISRVLPGTAAAPVPTSHRLVAMGLSERAVVRLLWLLAAVSGVIAFLAGRSEEGIAGLLAALFTVGMALFAAYLSRVHVREGVGPGQLPRSVTPLGVDFHYPRRLAEVVLDLLLVSMAYYGAYRLRFEAAERFLANFDHFRQSFPIVLGIQMVALFATGAYRGMWRYFGLSDGVRFAKGVAAGVVGSQVAIFYLFRFEGYSFSVFVIYGMLLLLLLSGSRASFRLIGEYIQRERQSGRRLAIYGAGDATSMAVRHLLNDPHTAYRIVGLVDDDPRNWNRWVHGYRVIGGYDHLVGLIMAGDVDAVAVTQENADTGGLASLCARHGVTLHRLAIDWQEIPSVEAFVAGGEGRVVRFPETTRPRPTPGVFGRGVAESPLPPAVARDDARGPASVVAHPGRPVRVAHIITRLILGGAQENTVYTAVGQHRDPHFDVTIVCGIDEAGEGNMFSEVTRAGVRTIVVPSLLREIRPLTDVKAIWDLCRVLRRGSYDVVHTHSTKAGIVGRVAARLARVPVVVHTLHGLPFHEYQSAWKNRLYIMLKRLCAPLSDTIISVSAKTGQGALAAGIGRPDQHVTVFSGFEIDAFLTVRQRLTSEQAKRLAGIPEDALVVGKIARFFALKGHAQFMEAASEIVARVPNVYFLFVGDGPLRDELREEARRRGFADRLVMVGRVAPELVPDYIQAMDVVVHTSLREGIARVLPQAGAVGKPVVAFHLDGAPEVVQDGVSGYLVPALDTGMVAARVVDLLRDPDRRRTFGEAGRAFAAQHFSIEAMVERINAIYVDLLARRAAASLEDGRIAR